MAANNAAAAGRQNNNNNNAAAGGGGGGMNQNDHVEFSVRAEEDLYLQGSEATIRRVTADTNYSCLMLKTQRFSSLFRHYAKYHGLRKDDLEYYFVNLLENEDTPESVQLQRGDTIMVRLVLCCLSSSWWPAFFYFLLLSLRSGQGGSFCFCLVLYLLLWSNICFVLFLNFIY
jgi:hypothetical protein